MPDSAKDPSPLCVVHTTAIVTIDGRQLLLTLTTQDGTGDLLSVALLPGPGALNLTAMVNQLLTAAFDLQLPEFVPDLTIEQVSGTVFHAKGPKPATPSYYSLSIYSAQLIGAPFGSQIPVSISDFAFSLDSTNGAPSTVTASGTVSTTVVDLPAVGAFLALTSDGASLIGFSLTSTVSIATLIETVLGLPLSDEVASLLPSFSPASTAEPMRFYQASKAISVTTGTNMQSYLAGFNVDNVLVSLLGYDFTLTLQVDNGFSVTASLAPLNLGIVVLVADPDVPPLAGAGLGGPLVNVVDQAGDVSISLATKLNFFPGSNPVSFPLTASYDSASGLFSGNIAIKQDILGVYVHTLGLAWDEVNGFRITEFPIPFDELSQFIDFGKEISKYFQENQGDCPKFPDVEFNELIQTTFSLSAAPTTADGGAALKVTGSYVLQVTGYTVATIDFAPILFPIVIPTSFDGLGQAIVDTLKQDASVFVTALAQNTAALTKLLGLVTLTEATKAGLDDAKNYLFCHYGQDELKQSMGDDGSDAAGDMGGPLDTLADAATVFVAATAAIAFFASIIKCLTGKQSDENNEAHARQAAAQQAIKQFLLINQVSAIYGIADGQIYVDVGWVWDQPDKIDQNVAIFVTAGSVSTAPISHDKTQVRVMLPPGSAGQTLMASVQGQYSYQNSTYQGDPDLQPVTIPALAVVSPNASYQAAGNSLPVTWTATPSVTLPDGGVASVTSYSVALLASGQPVAGMQTTIAPPTQGDQLAYSFNLVPAVPPLFWPDQSVSYTVQITLASNMQPLVAPPWVSAAIPILGGIGHTLVGLTLEVAPAQAPDSKEDPS